MPAQQALQHVVPGGKNIAHIVKNGETETFSEKRQADGESGVPHCSQTARSHRRGNRNRDREVLLDLTQNRDESCHRRQKKVGQGDDGNSCWQAVCRFIQRAGPGRQNPGAAIDLFQAKSGGASEDKLMIGAPKSVISRILSESAAKIGLRTNITGGGKSIECEVLPFGAFQGIVALVADESKSRTAYVSRQGKQTEFGR